MKILSDPTHLRKFVCNNLFGLRFLGKLRSIPSAFLVIDFLNKNLRYVTVLIDDDYVTFLFAQTSIFLTIIIFRVELRNESFQNKHKDFFDAKVGDLILGFPYQILGFLIGALLYRKLVFRKVDTKVGGPDFWLSLPDFGLHEIIPLPH